MRIWNYKSQNRSQKEH